MLCGWSTSGLICDQGVRDFRRRSPLVGVKLDEAGSPGGSAPVFGGTEDVLSPWNGSRCLWVLSAW